MTRRGGNIANQLGIRNFDCHVAPKIGNNARPYDRMGQIQAGANNAIGQNRRIFADRAPINAGASTRAPFSMTAPRSIQTPGRASVPAGFVWVFKVRMSMANCRISRAFARALKYPVCINIGHSLRHLPNWLRKSDAASLRREALIQKTGSGLASV